jgi:hypothetical protein
MQFLDACTRGLIKEEQPDTQNNLLRESDLAAGGTAEIRQLAKIRTEVRRERGQTLKRFLLIFSARIFDSSVDRAIPSLAAAPDGPNTRP